MTTVLLVLHFFVALALIGVVLLQRSEGGGLGIGSSQGMGAFMTGRGTANLLTRSTAVLATLFMVLAMALALINRGASQSGGSSILNNPPPAAGAPATPGGTPAAPSTAPAPGAPPALPALPATPSGPSVPNN
ncbi:preprotein translocase subunit SecG [Roseomonas gilardii]|uniref:preprotein translocase subunit SecG n=1 Tax=Roseomonas gilardii TaxID=257708 RepID=UPI000489B613|nr:preprotein translocase subunit SecG [Roseomonas gilardii]SUE44076.1 Preprotein translocase band 1 subunit [Roseomonas gilardii subsp. rosea]